MTLVETSEREVIEKAKAWRDAGARGTYRSHELTPPEVALWESVDLLEERERVAAEIAQGVIPPENLIFSEEPIVTAPRGLLYCVNHNDSHTDCAVALCEREHIAGNHVSTETADPAMSPTGDKVEVSPGIPINQELSRPPRKLSRREQEIEKRRRSDPTGADRPEIDYGDDSLPTAR